MPSTTQPLAGELALTLKRAPLPLGLGLATRDQAMPFQCKITGVEPAGMSVYPAAQASVAEVAVTPVREEYVPGLGLGTRDQVVPFQCTISVWVPDAVE